MKITNFTMIWCLEKITQAEPLREKAGVSTQLDLTWPCDKSGMVCVCVCTLVCTLACLPSFVTAGVASLQLSMQYQLLTSTYPSEQPFLSPKLTAALATENCSLCHPRNKVPGIIDPLRKMPYSFM